MNILTGVHALAAAGSGGSASGGAAASGTAVVSGLVLGLVGGGAVIVSGVLSPVAPPGPTLALYACPDAVRVVEQVPAGQRLLVTARSSDGAWLEVYLPDSSAEGAWAHADGLRVDGDVGSLPVEACGAEIAAGPPQGDTRLVSVAQATVVPTPGQQSPEPWTPEPWTPEPWTPQPVTPPPGTLELAELTANPASISGGDRATCPDSPRSTEITVTATSPAGVTSVTLYFQRPGDGGFTARAMAQRSSTAWSATVSTDADGIRNGDEVRYYVVATSGGEQPRTARLPASGSQSLTVTICGSSQPVLSDLVATPAAISGGDQRICPRDPRATEISVTARSTAGIARVILYYQATGGGVASKTMTQRAGTDTWHAAISTDADRIVTAGRTTYWVVATSAGTPALTARWPKSGSQSIAVTICSDTEGPALSNLASDQGTIWFGDRGCGPTTATISVDAVDPSGVASVTLSFAPPGQAAQTIAMSLVSGNRWAATISTGANWAEGGLSYGVAAADSGGRTSTSGAQRIAVKFCDRTGPIVSNLVANPTTIYLGPCTPRSSTITVSATDPSGVKGVLLSIRPPNGIGNADIDMTPDERAGSTWRATITAGDWQAGTLTYWVTATDTAGNSSRYPATRGLAIAVKSCLIIFNPGPSISNVSAPDSITQCGVRSPLSQISAMATDPDGVTGVVLWLQPPGLSPIPYAMSQGEFSWSATFRTDCAWHPGTLYFWIMATDGRGATSRYPATGARAITLVGGPS